MAKYTKLTSTATFTLWNTISNTYNFLKAFILFEYSVCILDLIHSFIHKSLSYETFASLNWNSIQKQLKSGSRKRLGLPVFCIIWPCPPGLDVCGESPDPCITQQRYFKLETFYVALFFFFGTPLYVYSFLRIRKLH